MSEAAASPAFPVPAGFVRRMRTYLGEMFPPGRRLLAALLLVAGFTRMLERIHGLSPRAPGLDDALGVWAAFGLMLMLRLMDELKDRDIDPLLFPGRPLPAGRVWVADIRAALAVVITLFIGLPALAGTAWVSALVVLGYALLMFRHFFARDAMRRHPLLALATHNPIVALLLGHLVVLFVQGRGLAMSGLRAGPTSVAILAYWMPLLAWEIARKIRAPGDEDRYLTYSRLLGRGGAVALAAAAQTLACALGLVLAAELALTWRFPAVLLLGYAVALWSLLSFLRRPVAARAARLKPASEAFVIAVSAASVVEHGLAGF